MPLLPNLADIERALSEGDIEGAIELVFEWNPDLSRDEAVDIIEAIERRET